MKGLCSFRGKFTLAIVICELLMLVAFGFFVRYDPEVAMPKSPGANYSIETDPVQHINKYYSLFQDVHIMMFIGFGFLMTFLKRYGYSSLGINFLIAAFVIQWHTVVHGWIDHFGHGDSVITVNVESMIKAEFCAAAILITFGAVLGKVSPLQMLIIVIVEVVVYEGNIKLTMDPQYIGATDIGDSMVVHTFGAYFGLAVAWVLHRHDVHQAKDKEESVYQSDLFAMIGTVFLWICWPSFNAGTAVEEGRVRAIVNTYYALTASAVTSFAISSLIDKKNRFNMVHIQNSTLAGGVAVGSVADFIIQPWAALLIGIVAGVVSVLGYTYLNPLLSKHLKLHDTCGVHNLHGMPGIISGLGSILAAGVSYPVLYGSNLENIFASAESQASIGRRAGMQAACLGVSLGLAILGGLITGFILKLPFLENPKTHQLFDDEDFWIIPSDDSKFIENQEQVNNSNNNNNNNNKYQDVDMNINRDQFSNM